MKKFDTLFPERTGAKKTSSNSTPGSPANAEAAKQEAAAEVRRTQEKVKAELSQKGFRETLKRIARDAQREAKKARPANAGGANGGTAADSSGFSDAMTKAMKGITKDLVSIVKDGKFKAPKASQNGGRSGRSRSGQSGSSTMSTLGGIANSASDFISDVASAPSVSTAPPASMAPISSSGELETGMLLPIVVLIALIAGGIALAWKFEVIGPDSTRFGKNSPATMAKGIQTRADIVRAFHQMALKPAVGSEAWWTHQKVVDEMVEETPDKVTPATTLSTLYEQARYLPEDVEFTSLQIEDAKRALTQCQR